jgi:hypothetical protein
MQKIKILTTTTIIARKEDKKKMNHLTSHCRKLK